MNDWSEWSEWSNLKKLGSEIPIITIGYSTFMIDARIAGELLHAASMGQIKEVEKKYIGGEYKVIVRSIPSVQVEHLNVIPDNKEEIKKLKQRLQELEGTDNA